MNKQTISRRDTTISRLDTKGLVTILPYGSTQTFALMISTWYVLTFSDQLA